MPRVEDNVLGTRDEISTEESSAPEDIKSLVVSAVGKSPLCVVIMSSVIAVLLNVYGFKLV